MGTPQADRQNGRNREKRRIGTHNTNIIFPGMGGEPGGCGQMKGGVVDRSPQKRVATKAGSGEPVDIDP